MINSTLHAESNSSIINAAKDLIAINQHASSRSVSTSISQKQPSDASAQPQVLGRQDEYCGEVSVQRGARKRLRETQAHDDEYSNMLRQKNRQQNQILNGYMERLDAAHNLHRRLLFDTGQNGESVQENQRLCQLVATLATKIDSLQDLQMSLFRVTRHLTRTVGMLQNEISMTRAQTGAYRQAQPDSPARRLDPAVRPQHQSGDVPDVSQDRAQPNAKTSDTACYRAAPRDRLPACDTRSSA